MRSPESGIFSTGPSGLILPDVSTQDIAIQRVLFSIAVRLPILVMLERMARWTVTGPGAGVYGRATTTGGAHAQHVDRNYGRYGGH